MSIAEDTLFVLGISTVLEIQLPKETLAYKLHQFLTHQIKPHHHPESPSKETTRTETELQAFFLG